MNRVEFMAELERLLADLPEDERQAAVQYYADYFADAGAENEAEVIRELGSPEKTAESIKADYYGRTFDESRFEHKDYMEKYGQQASGQQTSGQQQAGTASASGEEKKPWTSRGLKILLIVLIAIVVWPVSLGLICAVLGILAAVVCLFAGLVIAAVCVMIAGGVTAVTGLLMSVAYPPAALMTTGIGLLLFVLGLIATVGTVKLCMIVYPAMLRGFVELCRRPIHGKAV
ncbi:MAG TPA: DUF1700 domain-containing protein [Candidatus Mediterraneibacter quadrami]|uniref:DUF1700 domain-containing protein n=1 Tax=Candidatus Mediterraneibacter quadrami TaxID=2838684 RepID=A0A9D2RD94_9FIRM|nr:DUF1700 domain-containing protein [Candidatus Mediterraneibacter quadrami]